jgi:hypothetical protein
MNDNDYYTHKAKALLGATGTVTKRLDKLEAQCVGIMMTVRAQIDDLQGQIEVLNAKLDGQIKMLQESEPQAPEEPDWSAYTCNKCHTSKCEYMYDDPNKDGRCQRLDLGGHGPEEATDET